MVKRFKFWLLEKVLRLCTDPRMFNYADIRGARDVDILIADGKLWVNDDGECRLRGHNIGQLRVVYHGVELHHFQF